MQFPLVLPLDSIHTVASAMGAVVHPYYPTVACARFPAIRAYETGWTTLDVAQPGKLRLAIALKPSAPTG